MSVRGNWRAKFVFGAVSRGKSQLYYFLLLQPGSLFCVMVRLFPSHRAKDNLDYEVMRTASFVDNFLLHGSQDVPKNMFAANQYLRMGSKPFLGQGLLDKVLEWGTFSAKNIGLSFGGFRSFLRFYLVPFVFVLLKDCNLINFVHQMCTLVILSWYT